MLPKTVKTGMLESTADSREQDEATGVMLHQTKDTTDFGLIALRPYDFHVPARLLLLAPLSARLWGGNCG